MNAIGKAQGEEVFRPQSPRWQNSARGKFGLSQVSLLRAHDTLHKLATDGKVTPCE
jgi:hypothetical protein